VRVRIGKCKPVQCPIPLLVESDEHDATDMHTMQTISEFCEGLVAPEVPEDSFFLVGKTTVEVMKTTASKLGNRLLDLLRTENAMHIIKVNEKKFSVTVESTNPSWFRLKLRIYSRGPLHLLEFQRCDGDAIAFHLFFVKAAALLSSNPNLVQAVCDFKPPQLVQDTVSLEPFLDMATDSRDPVLLGEAASGLANAVVSQHYASELCAYRAFTTFEVMLRAGGYNVLQPLAKLLSNLLTLTENAAQFFGHEKFWQALLDVVVADRICEELQARLARVVSCALVFGASQEQLRVLQAARNTKGISNQVHTILQEAY